MKVSDFSLHGLLQASLVASLILMAPVATAVELLDEEAMSSLHLQGLDAPAAGLAGASRSPVSGSVMSRALKVAKDAQTTDPAREQGSTDLSIPVNLNVAIVQNDTGYSKDFGISQVENLQSFTEVFSSPR